MLDGRSDGGQGGSQGSSYMTDQSGGQEVGHSSPAPSADLDDEIPF